MNKHQALQVSESIGHPATCISDLLICLRSELGLRQVEFAKLLNMSQSALSKYENGLLIPPGDVFLLLFKVAQRAPISYRRFLEFCTRPDTEIPGAAGQAKLASELEDDRISAISVLVNLNIFNRELSTALEKDSDLDTRNRYNSLDS